MDNGVFPDKIAFLGFTNAACDAAVETLSKAGINAAKIDFPYFKTLHSLATRIGGGRFSLMTTKHRYQFDPQITVKEEWVSKGEPTSIVERPEHPILDRWSLAIQKKIKFDPDIPDTREMLSEFFNTSINNEELSKYTVSYIKAYLEFKKVNRLVDFDDVLIRVTDHEKVMSEKFPEFDILIIDEAQDLSNLQWDFVDRLVEKSMQVYLSGDDDQAIMETFGAAPDKFTSYVTNTNDVCLETSYRVPESVKDYVDSGVMKDVEKIPNRVDKKWQSSENLKDGLILYQASKTLKDNNSINKPRLKKRIFGLKKGFSEPVKVNVTDISPDQLMEHIFKRPNEEWLILCPTNATAEKFSAGMKHHYQIPHFLKNKPILGADPSLHNINVRTIHTSKGLGADNVAIVCDRVKDIQMLGDKNPKLAYVALTRAKKNLFPRVVNAGIYSDANKYCRSDLNRFFLRFPKPQYKKIDDENSINESAESNRK